jgi:hypothetical protein
MGLPGFGRKFSEFNSYYQADSADILVSPEIGVPGNIEKAIVLVYHSYQFEYYVPEEIGFDGGNFKITQAPALPTYTDPEIDILTGKHYDGWLFNTAIDNQMAFNSDQFSDELLLSIYEVSPALFGSSIYLGYAAATDSDDIINNRGWLIDDVAVRALPIGGNAPPIPWGAVTGEDLVVMIPGGTAEYNALGLDLEDDPLSYYWTIRDPGTGDILWGPVEGPDTGAMLIDWTVVGASGEYEVHAVIYDGHNPGVPVPPLTVIVQEPVFRADLNDTVTGGNVGWTETNQSGVTQWTDVPGSDSFLEGYGYKWGEFNSSYQPDSQGILLSPPIDIPSDIESASIYIRHSFQWLASLDGGNIKVVAEPASVDFSSPPKFINFGVDYDATLTGTVMDGQKAFGVTSEPMPYLSRIDLHSSTFGNTIRIGFAAASGTVLFNMRGWLIDDVVVGVE